MSEMIERMARAIAYADLDDDLQAQKIAGSPEKMWVDPKFMKQARAVAAAMREPTEEMLAACINDEDGSLIWHAMIDAALR